MLQRSLQLRRYTFRYALPFRSFSGDSSASTPVVRLYEYEKSLNDERLQTKRHTLAHILAMAVQKLFPDAQSAIGPCIDNGYVVSDLVYSTCC